MRWGSFSLIHCLSCIVLYFQIRDVCFVTLFFKRKPVKFRVFINCLYTHIYIYIYTYTHTHTHTHIYIYSSEHSSFFVICLPFLNLSLKTYFSVFFFFPFIQCGVGFNTVYLICLFFFLFRKHSMKRKLRRRQKSQRKRVNIFMQCADFTKIRYCIFILNYVLSITLTFSMNIHISSCSFSVMNNTDCYFW